MEHGEAALWQSPAGFSRNISIGERKNSYQNMLSPGEEKNYVLCYVDVEKDQCLTHLFSFKFKFILQIEALLLAICFKHLLQADFWLFFIETLFILYIQSFI